jgi:hypothetical protein
MRTLLLLVAGAMLAAACSSDSGPAQPEPIALVTWVGELAGQTADDTQPDTVDDKVGVVTDTDDPAAFDSFLGN